MANYFNSYSNYDIKALFDVIQKGIDLLKKDLQENSFNTWQEYAKTVVKIYSQSRDVNIYIGYLNFILSIIGLSPYDRLRVSLDYLINIAKRTG